MILDIKIVIASYDADVWYLLYRFDTAFRKFAISPRGRARYVELFTVVACVVTCVVTSSNATTEYRLFGKLHRTGDQPAQVGGGWRAWYQNGQLHRDNDRPATISDDVRLRWYQHGRLYRSDDLPTATDNDGHYWGDENSFYHRDNDMPAFINTAGLVQWCQHGMCHRDNGPAVMHPNGRVEWWRHGKMIKKA
jgi:hypothetical protein